MEEKSEQKQGNKQIIYLLGALLLLSVIGNIYLLNRSTNAENEVAIKSEQVDSLYQLKKTLDGNFQAMTFELDQFRGKNIQLDSLLAKADGDIQKQRNKIAQLIKENKDIPLIRRQLEEMKAIRDQYRIQIEQLINENKELKFANVNLIQEVDNLNKTTKDLSQKVELASVLKAENLVVRPQRAKGKGKLEDTDKAKRVSKIAITLVVAENKVAKAGQREVVMRLIKPDGYPVTDPNSGSGTFTKEDGRSTEYTLKKNIDFANERMEVNLDWEVIDELKTGIYIAEVYLDGSLIGNNKFNLK
jgi:predicted nuclease with TOPRIM domain